MPGTLASAPPISWPSLSDLARRLYGERKGLDTVGREVRRLRVRTRRIGREVRVEPEGAVRVLEARGVTAEQATNIVAEVVSERSREVPVLSGSMRTANGRQVDPYAAMSPELAAAALAYEQRMFGTSVTELLPREAPTDIKSTEDLLAAIGGQS